MVLSTPLALAGAALIAASSAPDAPWTRARSAHFEVLSDAGAAPAREAARRLERLRTVLLELFPNPDDTRRDITVLVVEDTHRFRELVPRERRNAARLAGFFLGGSERDYAVLRLSSEVLRPFEPIEHEYAHLILNGSLPSQPVWLAEGLAELLSGGLLDGTEARLGAVRPEHESLLRQDGAPRLRELLMVGYDSPTYLGHGDGGALYAGSWALVRWVVHRRGLQALSAYAATVAQGADPGRAFATSIADPREAQATLLDVPPGPVLRVPQHGTAHGPVSVDAPSRADVEHRLGDVLLQGGHSREARVHFRRALEVDPAHLPSRTSLGGLLADEGQWEAARQELEAVLERDPENPAARLRLARLHVAEALQRGVPLSPAVEARVVTDLEAALDAAPELYEAALLLASLRAEPEEDLVRRLEPLFEQQPERTIVAQTLSQLYLQRGDVESARRILERGRDAARDDAARYLCAHLLARLEGFSAATVEVRGDLVYLDCRDDGSLRFSISADPRSVKLEAASTRSFVVHGTADPDRQVEFLCGHQDRPITVRYDPAGARGTEVNGRVLWLALDRAAGN